jgi:hypothetical protein
MNINRNSKSSSPNCSEKPPWTHEVAVEKARLVAAKRNVPVFLLPAIGAYGERAWAISFESAEEKEAYAVQRELELKALHPEQSTLGAERRWGYGGCEYEVEPNPEPEFATGLSPPEWDAPTDAETDALDRDFD